MKKSIAVLLTVLLMTLMVTPGVCRRTPVHEG